MRIIHRIMLWLADGTIGGDRGAVVPRHIHTAVPGSPAVTAEEIRARLDAIGASDAEIASARWIVDESWWPGTRAELDAMADAITSERQAEETYG